MTRYDNSIIYKLYDDVTKHFYIGSTVQPLNIRLSGHKYSSRSQPNTKVYKHFNNIGWNNVKIEPIIHVSLSTRQQLLELLVYVV